MTLDNDIYVVVAQKPLIINSAKWLILKEPCNGLGWFIGSIILVILYEASILVLTVVSMAFEIVSIGFYILSIKSNIIQKNIKN